MAPRKTAWKGIAPDGGLDLSRGKEPAAGVEDSLSGWINARIDADYEEKAAKRGPWPVLGASNIGGVCLRKVAFEYERERELWAIYQAAGGRKSPTPWTNPDPPKFPGRMLRLFDLGDKLEDVASADMAKAGFRILTVDEHKKQFGFKACDDGKGWARLRGRIDGVVVVSLTPMVATPCLWECKSMNAKKFKAFREKGLKEANPEYYAQVQLYMWYLNLSANPCLFTVYGKDDSSYVFELVDFDPEAAQRASDDAVRVLEASTPFDIPRGSAWPDKPPCSWCRFKEKCWNEPKGSTPAASIPKPSWLGQ